MSFFSESPTLRRQRIEMSMPVANAQIDGSDGQAEAEVEEAVEVDVSTVGDLSAEDNASLKKVIETHSQYFPVDNSESWIGRMKERLFHQWASHLRRRSEHHKKIADWEEQMEAIRQGRDTEARDRLVALWMEKANHEMERKEDKCERLRADLEENVEAELANLTLTLPTDMGASTLRSNRPSGKRSKW